MAFPCGSKLLLKYLDMKCVSFTTQNAASKSNDQYSRRYLFGCILKQLTFELENALDIPWVTPSFLIDEKILRD